jgi:hypothetical protein
MLCSPPPPPPPPGGWAGPPTGSPKDPPSVLVEAPRSRAVTRSTSGAGLVVPGPNTPPPPEEHQNQHQHHVVGAGKGDRAADQRPSATCTAGGAGSHGGGEGAYRCYFAHTVCCYFECTAT